MLNQRATTQHAFFIGGLVRMRKRAVRQFTGLPMVACMMQEMYEEGVSGEIPCLIVGLTTCCTISLDLLEPYRRWN